MFDLNEQFLIISSLIVGIVLGPLLSITIARNRHVPGVPTLIVVFLAGALWCAGYALEILSPTLETKLYWAKFQYLGIVTVPIAWFFFTFQYLGAPNWTAKIFRFWFLFSLIPLLTLFLAWTNEAHDLIWRSYQLVQAGPLLMLDFLYGPWFWVFVAYSYVLLLISSFWLVGSLLRTIRLHRWQMIMAIIAVLIPWTGNLIYITHIGPIPELDATPFSFILAGLLFTVSQRYFHLTKILPIATQSVFDDQADCLIVLDGMERIVELNPVAEKLLVEPGARPIGKPLSSAIPALAEWIRPENFGKDIQVEMTFGDDADLRFFDLHISPITTKQHPIPLGCLIVLHDTTELKQESAQTYRALFENAGDAILILGMQGEIQQANQKAIELLGYTAEEMQSLTIYNLTGYDEHENAREKMAQALQGHSLAPYQHFLHARSGAVFPVENKLSLVRDQTGNPKFVQSIIRDISERVQAEQSRNQLMEEIKRSREKLRLLTFRLQEVQEIERREIAEELHDRVGQSLTCLNLNLQIIMTQLQAQSEAAAEAGTPADIEHHLQIALNLVEETTQQVRSVMTELYPPILEQQGLMAALHWYAETFSKRTGIAAQVVGDDALPRLSEKIEGTLFRITQEALNNAAKHAQATQLSVRVETSEDIICLYIEDDGKGFTLEDNNLSGGQPHWGLLTMKQRAESIGGQLSISSNHGTGTILSVIVACPT